MPATITLDQLAPTFTGQLLQPTDAGYDDARRVHNGLIDKKPAIVARCRGTADVVDAVTLARSMNLEIAVRGGGHNVGGRGTIDGGLMIDLAPMKGIHVDPAKRTNLRRHHRRNCREPSSRCAVPSFCRFRSVSCARYTSHAPGADNRDDFVRADTGARGEAHRQCRSVLPRL
jgi:hypothetical protein